MSDEPEDLVKPGSVNEEMVRKLLQMNPQLRGDGKTTKDVLSMVQAQTRGAAPPTHATGPLAKTPPPVNVTDEIRRLRSVYDQHAVQLRKESQEIASKARLLGAQEKAAQDKACARIIDAILRIDPDLLSKGSQVILQQEEAFLKQVGYTAQKLLAEEKRRKGVR